MKVAFFTLGCKVNQYETNVLQQLFKQNGYEVVPPNEQADVCVINSCTVTSSGDKKTRQVLHRLRRQHPDAVLALTGCFPQAFPQQAEELEEADVITGSYNRSSTAEAVAQFLRTGQRVVSITPHRAHESFERMQLENFSGRTRAFVKIEDGCDCYCSYCIIPTARGPVRSKPLEDLKAELQALAKSGFREVVLVGINLSKYGWDFGARLIDAVTAACSVEGIERVRLGSLEPEIITPEDIERMAALPKLCPQFHLALQSGCDTTLERMNRHYTTARYQEIADCFRKHFPGCALTTDIMVGFPGETEEEFEASMQFAVQIGFAKVHVFNYSIREGTKAAQMPDQLPKAVREARSAKMIAATLSARHDYLTSQIGRIDPVLFETKTSDGWQTGYTPHYLPVKVRETKPLSGQIHLVRLERIEKEECIGSLLSAEGPLP